MSIKIASRAIECERNGNVIKVKSGTVGGDQAQPVRLRAVGYCRTSGEGQRDNTSIPNQQEAIENFIEGEGWRILRHYIDESKTGSKIAGRDDFQRMMR